MMHMLRSMRLPIPAVALALMAAGCQGSGTNAPATQSTVVRESASVAPADLQLLCASAASEQLGIPSETVLPTSSAAISDGYQVTLTFTGGSATCAVRTDGTVVSVQRA